MKEDLLPCIVSAMRFMLRSLVLCGNIPRSLRKTTAISFPPLITTLYQNPAKHVVEVSAREVGRLYLKDRRKRRVAKNMKEMRHTFWTFSFQRTYVRRPGLRDVNIHRIKIDLRRRAKAHVLVKVVVGVVVNTSSIFPCIKGTARSDRSYVFVRHIIILVGTLKATLAKVR